MKGDVTFEFEGATYVVGPEVHDRGMFLLPDKRMVRVVGGWTNAVPPAPLGLEEADYALKNSDKPLDLIALIFNIPLAEKLSQA